MLLATAPRALAAARCSVASQAGVLPRVAVLHSTGQGGLGASLAAAPCFRPSWAASTRAISSTAAAKKADSGLVGVLEREAEFENANYKPPALAGAPAGWELSEKEGETKITLTKQHGNEKIEVELLVNDQADDEDELEDEEQEEDDEPEHSVGEGDDEEEAEPAAVLFNVAVTKGGQSLVFECMSDGTYLEVSNCSLEPAGTEEIDMSVYTGPVYHELDQELQEAFVSFLEERGVHAELGKRLQAMSTDKEQREYVAWLGNVQRFVSSK